LPSHNRRGLHDDQRRSPLFPDLHEEYPEQAIAMTKLRAWFFPVEDRQLLSQRGIL
jgi:hypothetical protein